MLAVTAHWLTAVGGMVAGFAYEVGIHDGPGALERRVPDLLTRPLAHPPG